MNHLDRAIELARQAMHDNAGGPFGAVIVRDGDVIAEGSNSVVATNDPTAHAEVVAIRRASAALGRFSLEGCDIYSSSEPCPMCLASIYWARLDRIYYAATRDDAARGGFDDSYFYDELARPESDRSVPTFHVEGTAAPSLFDEWLAKHDRTRY
jgi:tRNA(Arg) A34 adenosine deaminase TadA